MNSPICRLLAARLVKAGFRPKTASINRLGSWLIDDRKIRDRLLALSAPEILAIITPPEPETPEKKP
ncbi:MAG TPA: hypothetical protein VHD62_09595 [Opitutaceae bacterium]|nr:hypothetical protein [Opitutaceae bacterium]